MRSPLSPSRLLWLTFAALCCALAHASTQDDGAASHARVRIHEIATPIEIDGEALEWTGVEVLHLDRRSQLVATDRIDWDGPEDASALVRIAYDEGHLYLYARIFDRGPLAPRQGETWESGDVLELFFDSDLRDGQAGELAWNDDDLQLMLLPFAPGRPWSFVGRPEKVVARGSTSTIEDRGFTGIRVARKLEQGGVALEAVIPLHNLPGFEPGTREIGFNIAYGDRDEGRGNYNYLVWAGSRSPAESTGWFGRLVFDGPAPLVPREAATGREDGSQVLTILGALLPAVSVLVLLLVVRHIYRRSIAMHPTRQRIVLGAALLVAFAAVLVPFVVATLRSSELRARSDSIVRWVVSKLPDLERSGLSGFEGPSRDAPFVDLLTGGAVRKPLESDFLDLQTMRPDAFGWKRRDFGGGTVVWPYDVELRDAPLRVGLAGLRVGDRLRLVVSQPRTAPAEVDEVPNVAAHDDADVPRAPGLWVEAASIRSDLECVRMAALGGGSAPSTAAVIWSADFELPQGVREVSIGTTDPGSVTIEGVCARGREQVAAWRPIFLETVSRLGSGVRTSLVGAAPLASRIKLERGQSWTCELTPAVERVDRLWVLAAGLAGDDFRATKDGAVVATLRATMVDGTAAEWALRHQVELFARRLDANSELQRLTTDTRARVAYEWESMDGATQVTPGVAFDLPDLSSVRSVTLNNDGNYPIELRSVVCAIPRVIDSDTGPESLLVPAERIGAYRLAPNALAMLGDASFHVFRDRVLSQPEGDASRRMPAELADDLQRDGAAATEDFFGDGSFESWVRLDGEGWGAAAFCVSVRDPTLGSGTRSVWIFGLIVALLAVPWLVVHFLFAVAPRASMRAQLLGSVAFAAIVPLAIVSVFVNNLLEQNQSERQRNNLLDDLGVASRRIEELGRTLVLEATDQAEAIADIVRRPRTESSARFEDELAAALAAARPKGFSDASFLTCEVPDESSRERVLRVVDRPESHLLGDTPLGPGVGVYLRWGKVFVGARAEPQGGMPVRCAVGRELDGALLDSWAARGQLGFFDLNGYPLAVGAAAGALGDKPSFVRRQSLPSARSVLVASIDKLRESGGPEIVDLSGEAEGLRAALQFVRDRAGAPIAVLGAFERLERPRLPLLFGAVGVPTFFVIVGSLLVVFVSFLTLSVTGRISDPIDEMSSTALRFSAGDLAAEVHPVAGTDEIARLSEAFRTMSLELRQRIQKQEHMNRAMARLTRVLDLEAVVDEACNVLVEVTGSSAALVIVFDGTKGTDTSPVACTYLVDGEPDRGAVPLEFHAEMLRARGPYCIGTHESGALVLPIRLRDRHRAFAVLALNAEWSDAVDLDYLQALVDQVAAAMETARLYGLAIEDPSTGLPVPRWYRRSVSHEIDRAQKEGEGVTIARVVIAHAASGTGEGDGMRRAIERLGTGIANLLANELAPPEAGTRLDSRRLEILLPGLGPEAAAARLDEIQQRIGTLLQGSGSGLSVRVVSASYPEDAGSSAFLVDVLDARQDAVVQPVSAPVLERGGGIFASTAMHAVLERLDKAAMTELTLLIEGETGVGKEILANLCHEASARSKGPLVKVNCASIPESLLESALFGHERGAFTGAALRHRGFFEQAHRGTLFLDEVGEMPLEVQAGLLRVLQDRSIRRVGGVQDIEVDVRVVAATHRDLQVLVQLGRFRQDLYFRLQGLRIQVPPLRDRMEELPLLVERLRSRHGPQALPLSTAALDALHAHSWPGNLRELENVVQRALVLARGEHIEPEDLELVPSAEAPQVDDAAMGTQGSNGESTSSGAQDVVEPRGDSAEVEDQVFDPARLGSPHDRWQALVQWFENDAGLREDGLSPKRYCEVFGVSRRTATRDLGSWLDEARLTCRGQKRSLRYFLAAC